MKYTPSIVSAYFKSCNLPQHVTEYRFEPTRRWRFDLAWPNYKLALEVQGGIWSYGRHSRGAAMLKEWEKLNRAAVLGWRVLYCHPRDLCMSETVETIRGALEVTKP